MSLKARSIATALLTACGLLSLTTVPAKAYSININNGNFEATVPNGVPGKQLTDPLAHGDYGPNAVIPGWSLYDPSNLVGTDFNGNPTTGDAINVLYPSIGPNPGDYAVKDGLQAGQLVTVYLTDPPGTTTGAGIQQTLSDVLAPNTTYTLNAQIYNPQNFNEFPPELGDLSGFPGYDVQLWAGDILLNEDNNSLGSNIPEAGRATSTVTFTTDTNSSYLGKPITIRLIGTNVAPGLEMAFDDVKLDATPVPEPSTILGILAVTGLGYGMKRRKLAK